MTVFRASFRLSDPDGRSWEVFEYRIRLPAGGDSHDPGLAPDQPVGITTGTAVYTEIEAGLGVIDAAAWLLGLVPSLLRRLLWDVPRAAVCARRCHEWTIEAVSWYPQHASYTWTATDEHRRQVARDVRDQLLRGQIPPRPRDGTLLTRGG
jgi:hypothetical protein